MPQPRNPPPLLLGPFNITARSTNRPRMSHFPFIFLDHLAQQTRTLQTSYSPLSTLMDSARRYNYETPHYGLSPLS